MLCHQTMAVLAWARPRWPHSDNSMTEIPLLPGVPPMHELSIAMSIVDMAQEEAERRNVQVDAVHLELGALAGVVKEALLFSYTVACDGTLLEGSRLVVKDIPIEVF